MIFVLLFVSFVLGRVVHLMDILDEIVALKRRDLEEAKRLVSFEELAERAKGRAPRDFEAALARPGVSIIAEMKKSSPSAGLLRKDYDPAAIALSYEAAGAAAISVLTEERYFQGCAGHLALVRGFVSLPLLRKDFIIDEYQVVESAAAGADAVLLIARLLTSRRLENLAGLCYKMQLTPLVEVHGEDEIEAALSSGARVIGINNRDLATLTVDIGRTLKLREMIPADRIVVSESGIRSGGDIRTLAGAGVDAFLIGERLLRKGNPGEELKKLMT